MLDDVREERAFETRECFERSFLSPCDVALGSCRREKGSMLLCIFDPRDFEQKSR